MLSPEEWESWCQEVGILPHARALIDQIRSSNPSRRVGGGRSNVSGRYPSRKMGVTIQFESHRVELAGIYEMEHDAEVLEFYDQPIQIKLNYETLGGRPLGILHTPDFFAIRKSTAGWEEWKTEEDLIRLAERNPNRYCSTDNGQWRCPPGEACAKEFGFYYRVRSSREINWVYQRNVQFLEDYLRSDLPIRPESHERILALVSAQPTIGLSDLFQETEGVVTRDEVFAMIAVGPLEVDLSSAPLTEPNSVRVLLNRSQGEICAPVSNGAAGASAVALLLQMGPPEIAEANRRLKLIRAYQSGGLLEGTVPARTVRRWLQRYRQAETLQGDGYRGLLPRFHNCGNRNSKLPEQTRALMSKIIETDMRPSSKNGNSTPMACLSVPVNPKELRRQVTKPFLLQSTAVYKATWCSNGVAGVQHISWSRPTWNCTSPHRDTAKGLFTFAMPTTPSSTSRSFAQTRAATSVGRG
jgi:putative transposase